MQVRILRQACEKWNQPMEKTASLFAEYHILQYLEECFGIFHVQGDEAVLEDVEAYLKNKGEQLECRNW